MSSYVQENLIKGEKVVFETRLHWLIFIGIKPLLTLFIAPTIARVTNEFVITDRRVIMKTGWFTRDAYEMNLSKIESVKVHQPFRGRIFGFGSLELIGTGGSTETFHNIANPSAFRKAFQQHST